MFKQIINLNDIPDGSVVFWVKHVYVWEDTFKTVFKKGKKLQQRIKDGRLKEIKYEYYRCRLDKHHHKTVSGDAICLVSEPNADYPYMVPWQGDWIYAACGSDSHISIWVEED